MYACSGAQHPPWAPAGIKFALILLLAESPRRSRAVPWYPEPGMGGAEWEDAQGFLSLSFQEQVFQFERGSVCEPNWLHQGGARNRHEQRPWSLALLTCTC